MIGQKVNEDLVKERNKCTFDVEELIHFVDGGKENTVQRRELEERLFSNKDLKDDVPVDYLSHKEKYENAVKKACIVTEIINEHRKQYPYNILKLNNVYRPATVGVLKNVSPFLLHNGMFVPTIMGQGTPEQQEEWLPKATAMKVIGTYAQTELGHGTFLRGLETTATYDPTTEEFVINTPTLTAYKWWPGGLAHTTNYCIVVAQLYIKDKCLGVHPFIVQLRDLETHQPLPGIKLGEIGPKLGFQTANNGFLAFDNVRIPRKNMLMKNSQVLKDGTFVKSQNDKLTYGTMVMVRVTIVRDAAYCLASASTIAVRYAAVRHQSQPKPNEPEPQILDYLTQQHKLFIHIATSHAFRIVGDWLWDTFVQVNLDMRKGNMDQLPELHALACCLKAVSSLDASLGVEQCRLACGGHGYMASSNFPVLYGLITASVTYEGEHTVLLLQTARYLVKAWKQTLEGKAMTPTVSYLLDYFKSNRNQWENTPQRIVIGFQEVAAGKTKAACETIEKYVNAGNDYEDAWNLASVQLVSASEAHCRAIICNIFLSEIQRLSTTFSQNLAIVMQQLVELYLVYWTLQKTGDLLEYSSISKADIAVLRNRYEELLTLIRPNAVGLVDGFGIRDETLGSALGSYDGRVYERLMEEALKSPLNAQPVNDSFHKYLKPFMSKAKL
ncbi:probable peroxisomal acyl-coenzyme A oxidase 1 [Amyelois transitella]|uniref:probable peroxisomal acyl-coenzyme A oxidase 1 n=1 Tax=Amyelois transitella TaxID=680683 RepID=UPI00067D6E83|nr:probable peroxisomal acyl-coenzyme A oxidase 1 [Amyelois transitella]